MPMSVASVPPATDPIPPGRDPEDGGPTTRSVSFAEIWADKKGPTFFDVLDIVNPLQHIPIISTIYREVTGDEIGLVARMIGGGIFGGPLGFFNAALTAAVEEASGGEPGDHMLAALRDAFSPAPAGDDVAATDLAESSAEAVNAIAPAAGLRDADDAGAPAPQDRTDPLSPAASTAPAPAQTLFLGPPARLARPRPFAPAPAASGGNALAHADPLAVQPAAASERARIARRLLDAQRAQANILMAGRAADQAEKGHREQRREADRQVSVNPFREHPNAIPPGAPPEWVGRAMEQALDRYRRTMTNRGRPPPAGAFR